VPTTNVARQPTKDATNSSVGVENRFERVVNRELWTATRKRGGSALQPGRFPASGRGARFHGDSGVRRGEGLAAALSVWPGPSGGRRELQGFRSSSRPNLSNSLDLSVSAGAYLTRGSDWGWRRRERERTGGRSSATRFGCSHDERLCRNPWARAVLRPRINRQEVAACVIEVSRARMPEHAQKHG